MTKIPPGAYTIIAGRKRKLTRPHKSHRKSLEEQVETVFKAYIRNRDKKCCTPNAKIFCGGPLTCGHLFSGAGKSVRWDERFAFGQCRNHNYQHEHRPEIMTSWFINTYGKRLFNQGYHRSWRIKRFSLEELESLLKKFRN